MVPLRVPGVGALQDGIRILIKTEKNMKRIYRTFILLPLVGCFLWTGCSGEDEQALPAADGTKIQVNFSLSAPRMTETGEVSASTRALTALTLEEESAVKSLSYFEFSGTADDSRCIGKGTASMGSGNYIASLSLSASTDVHAVYVVADRESEAM